MLRAGLVLWTCVVLGRASVASADPGREPDALPVPAAPEVASSEVVALPVVPSFALPPVVGGIHDVRELRVGGRGLLGTELTVAGYVTWIYDCMKALARRDASEAETRLRIEERPDLCERPKFYLGARPAAPPELALWVVDVPRPLNKREEAGMSAAQRLAWPSPPRLDVGNHVAVTGTFAIRSPHGEQNSDGLVVYRSLAHLAASAPTVAVAAPPAVTAVVAPAAAPRPAAPMRAIVPVRDRNDSIERYEACNRALDAHRLAEAITECRAAITAWRGNHLAWYALGNAFASRADWRVARDAYGEAARLRPDAAMYQLYEGIAAYQILPHDLHARAAGSSPAALAAALRAIELDPGAIRLALRPYRLAAALSAAIDPTVAGYARSRDALAAAARLAPDLALAHYYLGLTERAQDHARLAAAAFTRSIQADPSQAAPYIALIELYRAWDYTAQSVVVAHEAASHARSGTLATLAYELGMSYVASHEAARALAAFSRAISAPDGVPQARFQRGQTYLRIGDVDHASADLEAFVALTDPSLAFEQGIARSQLTEIARKHKTTADSLRVWRQANSTNN
ncbi:MAG: hypothetical protein ABIY55_27110 [Kofleriaceae bacterium]